ncbi:MAG TPA: DNA-3-methyladenine glycosylase [Thermomicrobiales bacterium]|nr:DNA-3-methyladenine glycosylase [Thermomicrobiales bacterium]
MVSSRYLRCDAFAGEVTGIAHDIIGRSLVVRRGAVEIAGLIVETEAYGGVEDPASHAAFRPGGRAAAMVGPPGMVYVYSAYGVYPCFNIVTGPEGEPSAVLLRAVQIEGEQRVTSGPGRLTRAMGIDSGDHGALVCGERFGITAARVALTIVATPRIGITRGVDLPWRFLGTAIEATRA